MASIRLGDVIKQIKDHTSIRKFKNQDIPKNILEDIFLAASQAPTGGNLQNYSIVITKDQKRKKKLSDIHFGMEMILAAPVILTFLVDVRRNQSWAKDRDSDLHFHNLFGFLFGTVDAIGAAQNMILTAESHGLGTCHSGATYQRVLSLIDFFQCPRGVIPIATLVLGYPDEIPDKRTRLPLAAICMNEIYETSEQTSRDEHYKEKEEADLSYYLSKSEILKKVKELKIKSLPEIYSQIKYLEDDCQIFSENFTLALKRQGFLP